MILLIKEKRCGMKQNKNVNLLLIIIGILGFFFCSFFLIYHQVRGGFLLSLFFMVLFLEAYILRIELPPHHLAKMPDTNVHYKPPVPLSSGFMVTSIVGGLISLFIVLPLSLPWGVTFTVVFGIMFIASIVSMTKAPVGDEALMKIHMDELAVHNKVHRRK